MREAAISLRHEKLILFHLDNPREYLKRFDTYTWDEEADAAAEEFIQWYVERFRPELERQLDILSSGPAFGEAEEALEDLTAGEEEDTLKDLTSGEAADTIRSWHKDLTNDENEVVIAIDLQTGETLFVRYGDENSVTLHDTQKKLVEDRYVALLHHHPNNSAASLADLDATKWLKGDFLLVSNPDGTLHRYARVGETLIPLEPTRNPEYAAPVDKLETALADAAYLIQTLSELGNPPEMVMRQRESSWWKKDNIIVPYHTDETIENVAARMGIPSEHLEWVNDGKREEGIMYIPLPGWSTRRVLTLGGEQIQGHHSSGRTFLRSRIAHNNRITHLSRRWDALSPVEQQIEMALTATATEGLAIFDNIQSFDSANHWITDNIELIEEYAGNAGVPTELLKTILMSEILYDYSNTDAWQDILARRHMTAAILEIWKGTGVGNVHYVTLRDAYTHLSEMNATDIWHRDPAAPDLSAAEFKKLETFALPDGMDEADFLALPIGRREANESIQREARYPELDFYSVQHPIALYLATNEGSINAASIVTRMILDDYLALDESRFSENLTAEDMARLWGRYRTAHEALEYDNYGPNAHLALPVAEYFLDKD
ncbi:MAG: hypothetical protein OXG53_03340 [Chloroflexi bacterium]|nr:hypothetical protein [Chloroflexota bacterium]